VNSPYFYFIQVFVSVLSGIVSLSFALRWPRPRAGRVTGPPNFIDGVPVAIKAETAKPHPLDA
jgi:hypothetical protein